MVKREEQANIVNDMYEELYSIVGEIQAELDFEAFLGSELWELFRAYTREDTYENDNYISDGLNNAQLFSNARRFLSVAENEIYKSAELQHSITASMKNLLQMQ